MLWQPIKFSEKDKIPIIHRGLFKIVSILKNLNKCSETAKIALFHVSHYKSLKTISHRSNQTAAAFAMTNMYWQALRSFLYMHLDEISMMHRGLLKNHMEKNLNNCSETEKIANSQPKYWSICHEKKYHVIKYCEIIYKRSGKNRFRSDQPFMSGHT